MPDEMYETHIYICIPVSSMVDESLCLMLLCRASGMKFEQQQQSR